ncbi:NAD(P)/FAD-dependent oxidoreductase [Aquimarina sp. AU58]|uniref:phytoene desaturase family protein n=1 Tax=Aquimarina sp. AU58 TaxID=1874112 RepID=UPI000D6DDDD9|nr:NAD(P)-binding protein [Aquimarina sp. AU58]
MISKELVVKTKEVNELIIGAGLTGLIYGITLLEKKKNVAIVEGHIYPGGYATSFVRNKRKYRFDCSQHKITGLGKNANLRDVFERIDLWDKLDFKYFDELFSIHVKGQYYHIPGNIKGIKIYLNEQFPEEKESLDHFFHDINTIGYQNYMFVRMLLGEYQLNRNLLPETRQLQNLTVKQYFQSYFQNEHLIEVLSAISMYLGTHANEANAVYFLHYLYAAFCTKPGYVLGTAQSLSNVLLKEFKERGGYVSLKDTVHQIELNEEGEITRVNSRKHHFVTKTVTATCSPHNVMKMLPEFSEKEAFESKLQNLKFGWGHFCVYIITDLDPEELGFTKEEYILVSDKGDILTPEEKESDERYDKLSLSVTNYHKMDPECGRTIQLIVLDYKSDWFELEEQAYLSKKERIQERIIRRAYQYFPKLEGHILYKESSTPKTNKKYTNSPEGSAFGYKISPNDNMRFLSKSPVRGLKFVGTWASGAGYESAMCQGFMHAKLS